MKDSQKQFKHNKIIEDIIKKIEIGDLLPGEKVPSENELIATYSVSNTTARKSLLDLELQGWVKRIKGKGTFVLNRFEDRHITRVLGVFEAMKENFTDKLVKEGFTPKNILIEKIILDNGITSRVNNKNYSIEGPVLKIRRLRFADDVSLKDETRFISLTLCPRLNIRNIENKSLINIYEEDYNLKLSHSDRSIGCTILNSNDESNYFENESPIAAFILDAAIFCTDQKIVEIEQSYYKGDKYKFIISDKSL
jgi:GntR family transcriptional regulator